jgi:uncharacterized repeat protein (TIGR01451 family)
LHRRGGIVAIVAVIGAAGTATATHFAIDTQGHTTVEQTIVPVDPAAGYTQLKTGPGEPYVIRETETVKALADRDKRRVSLAYMSQMTDFQLADEESPARVEFVDPGPSSAWRPQEGFTPFQIEATIRQINLYADASPVAQGDGTRNAMDMALITGDQADNQHLNETVWVRELLEGGGPTNFNGGLSNPADYADPSALGASCGAFFARYLAEHPDDPAAAAAAAAAEGARYTGVQDYDDYPIGAPAGPLYYDPDEPTGQWEDWPTYMGLLDRAQQIVIDPVGLKVPFYITNGNHDVLVQGNEDANQALEDIATGCFKALGSTTDPEEPPDGPDPNVLLSPSGGMLVPPDPRRQFVSKPQIKEIYGATDEGALDDDHGFAYVDPEENEASNGSASYYAWDPPQTPGMRFISIDTNSEGGQTAESFVPGQPETPGSSNGNLDDPQFQWLKRELQAAKSRNRLVVIFGHHPVRSMDTQVEDEQAPPCTGPEDEHGHDVNPGCDMDPRFSGDDPTTPEIECIHNGRDDDNLTCKGDHESFEDLMNQFPNVAMYVPGHTHEHRLEPFKRASDGSTWWEVNTSAVIDYPNQSRLIELMDNRDGTLSIFNTVVDHAAPATAPEGCTTADCAMSFTEPQLASIGRTLTYNDPDNNKSGAGAPKDRNAELLMGDPRPVADLSVTQTDTPDPAAVGKPLTYTLTVTNSGPGISYETTVLDDLPDGVTFSKVQTPTGACAEAGGQVECDLGPLVAQQSVAISVTVVPNDVGQITNTARVRGNVSDRGAANDASSETTTVVATLPDPDPDPDPDPSPSASPDPTVTATADPAATTTATPTATPLPVPGAYDLPKPYPVPRCIVAAAALRGVAARGRGRRVALSFRREPGAGSVQVDLFQSSAGSRVVGERLVKRFSRRTRSFTFAGTRDRRGRRLRDGYYFVRFTASDARDRIDVRRRVLRRSRGRWSARPAFDRFDACSQIITFKLERPVFGGATRRSLNLAYRVREDARVRVDVLRGGRVVKRLREVSRRGGFTYRVRLDRGLRRRGDHRVRIVVRRGNRTESRTLTSRRL